VGAPIIAAGDAQTTGCYEHILLPIELRVSFLHMQSHLHKSRRVSNCCSLFAGAADWFCIPRAQQYRKTVGAAAWIAPSLPRIALARSNLLPRHTEQALLAPASKAAALNPATAPAAHTARLDEQQCSTRSDL